MQARNRPEQLDIGAILTAPTKDPEWLTKCLIMGILAIVPIVGSFNMTGWTKAIADARTRGETTLPPANLSYIGAGWRMFLAWLPLVAVVMAGMMLLAGGLGAVAFRGARGDGASDVTEAVVIAVIMTFYLGLMAFSAVVTVAAPAINFLHIIDGERFPSLAFKRQWEIMKDGGTQYLLLFVAILLAGLVAQLGVFAFIVGVFITIPYAQAMQGVALAEFARILRPTSAGFQVDGSVGGASGTPFGVKV